MKPNPMLDDYESIVGRCQVTVLTKGDALAGLIVLEATDEGFLLNNIAVDPLHRGKGLGSLLLQFAEDEARRQGYGAIYLYTNVKMTENQAIYAARGYSEFSRRAVNGRDAVFMRKTFGAETSNATLSSDAPGVRQST